MSGIGYRPEIDGLRALAVVPVVMFHLGLGFPGGFVGVDVFFVISGFLITGIIRRGLENETFSLAEFWERRIRRIFPALFVVLMTTLAVGYWFLLPAELEELGESSVAQALLLANVYFWRDTGYFAGPAELKPLLHTWSLAVEEQFYLLLPLLLMFSKKLSRPRLFWGLASISLISLCGSVYGTMFYPSATFYLLPTRAWELMVGSMLAVLPWQCNPSPRRDNAIAMVGFLAIILPVFFYHAETPFPGLTALPPVIGTASVLFATSVTPATIVGRVLSLRPIVFVGLISYSLYLWHWPAIVFVRTYCGQFEWPQLLLAAVGSVALAVLSWRFVETPVRQNSYLKRRRRLFTVAFLLSSASMAIGGMFSYFEGLPSRLPAYSKTLHQDIGWTGREFSFKGRSFREGSIPGIGQEERLHPQDDRLSVVVWGDSHGMVLCGVIDKLCKKYGLHGKAINCHGALPLPNVRRKDAFRQGDQFKERIVTWIDAKRPKAILLIGDWSWYLSGTVQLSDGQPDIGGFKSLDQRSKNLEIIRRNLQILVKFCGRRDINLVLINKVPSSAEITPARNIFLYSVRRSRKLSDKRTTLVGHAEEMSEFNNMLSQYSSTEIKVYDPAPYFCDDEGLLINYRNGRSNYRDASHVTAWGAQLLEPMFENVLRETVFEE
jgi:peptidoglycan/LPS O-acetylase OafA/YrhL